MKTKKQQIAEPRSSLLTVLCVLTFIGSGWTIVSGVWVYFTADETASLIEDVSNRHSDNNSVLYKIGKAKRKVLGKEVFDKVASMFGAEKIRYSALVNILSSIFTLSGAMLMWKLKIAGFYCYVFGVAISLLTPLLIYGLNFIGTGASISTGFIGLIFVSLYALEWRSLTQVRGGINGKRQQADTMNSN